MIKPTKEELKNLKIDKLSVDLAYNDEKHWYWNVKTFERYVSVTQLISKYHTPFNEHFWGRMKALTDILGEAKMKKIRNPFLRRNGGNFEDPAILKEMVYHAKKITTSVEYKKRAKEYIAEWKQENVRANTQGTEFHLKKEEKLLRDGYIKDEKRNITFPVSDNYDLNAQDRVVVPEPILYSHKYKIAGQSDKVIRDLQIVHVNDYKTNKKLEFESYLNYFSGKRKKMLYPLNHLDDCNGRHYEMQLSTYAYFIEEMYGLKIGKLTLEYTNNYKDISYYELSYRKQDVINLLEHFKENYQ